MEEFSKKGFAIDPKKTKRSILSYCNIENIPVKELFRRIDYKGNLSNIVKPGRMSYRLFNKLESLGFKLEDFVESDEDKGLRNLELEILKLTNLEPVNAPNANEKNNPDIRDYMYNIQFHATLDALKVFFNELFNK